MKTHHYLIFIATVILLFAVLLMFLNFVIGLCVAMVAMMFYGAAGVVIPEEPE